MDDLSNWYIRRSRRRFYGDDQDAFGTLWWALVQAVRVIAPVMPFLAERLWRVLVADPVEGAPASVFLAGWPEAGEVEHDRCSARSPRRAAWSGSGTRRARRRA